MDTQALDADKLERLENWNAIAEATWETLRREWIGTKVVAKQDIVNPREPPGRRVYVRSGSIGTIVDLRPGRSPFLVHFSGFPHNILMRPEELLADQEIAS